MAFEATDLTKQAIKDSYDSNIKERLTKYNSSRTDDVCQIRTNKSSSHRYYNMSDTVATKSGRNAEVPNTGGEAAKLKSKGAKVTAVDVKTGAWSVKNYFFEDDFWVTDITINSPIVSRQSSAIYLRDDLVFMDALEAAYTGFNEEINGETYEVKIPDENKFGNIANAWDFGVFKEMLVAATTLASDQGVKMKVFMDMDAQNKLIKEKEILSSDYFSKKILERNTIDKLQWNERTKFEVFPKLKNELYGKVDPWTKGRVYVVVEQCVGKLRPSTNIKGKVVELDETDEVLFKSKFMTGAKVVDPMGIFVYEYDWDAAAAASVEPVSAMAMNTMSLANNEQLEQEKEIEKMRMERVEKELELERLRVANKQAAVTETQEAPATTTTKAAKKPE